MNKSGNSWQDEKQYCPQLNDANIYIGNTSKEMKVNCECGMSKSSTSFSSIKILTCLWRLQFSYTSQVPVSIINTKAGHSLQSKSEQVWSLWSKQFCIWFANSYQRCQSYAMVWSTSSRVSIFVWTPSEEQFHTDNDVQHKEIR